MLYIAHLTGDHIINVIKIYNKPLQLLVLIKTAIMGFKGDFCVIIFDNRSLTSTPGE